MIAAFDVVIVGAGPGGIAAATVAAEAGRRVCLLDDNERVGGQIWRGLKPTDAPKYPHGAAFNRWIERLHASGCALWTGLQVVDVLAGDRLRVERTGEIRDVQFDRLILATGARERFLPFPGWTLPGVVGVGGLQALVKAGLDVNGKRVVLAGSGPLLLAVGAAITKAGARVVGIYEQAPLPKLVGFSSTLIRHPAKIVEGLRYWLKTLRVPFRTSHWVANAEGNGHVERATLTDGRRQWRLECDFLACGFHLVPNLELPKLLGCHIEGGFVAVNAAQQSSVANVACIGELTGVGGLEKALVEGQIAGHAAAGRSHEAEALFAARKELKRFASAMQRAFALRPELRALAAPQTRVCRCEDVPYAAIAEHTSWRAAKLHTRCGMGSCQGRICGAATEFLFGWETTGSRPPVFPAAVETVAAIEEEVSRP